MFLDNSSDGESDATYTLGARNEAIIVDELSLIRHQILLSSGYLGGPSESIPRSFTLDQYLNDTTIPRVFAGWPPLKNRFKNSAR